MESEATSPQPQKQKKPTAQPSGAIELMAWFEVNKKRLAIGGALALAVILVAALFLQQQGQRERSASRALSEIKVPVNPAQTAPPGTVEALVKLAIDYRGTEAAPRALLTSAGLLFVEKKYAEAEARFTQVNQEYPGSGWTAEALYGIAVSLEAQGKTAEATAKFEELRKNHDKSPVIDDAKMALAHLYETQKPEEAFKLYDDLTKNMTGSPLANEARTRLDDLLKARPELAKLKESLAPPMAPPVSPFPPTQTIQLTNQARGAVSNVANITMTNAPGGTSKPVQIQLTPTPAPGPAPAPAPAPAPPK